MIHVNKLLNKKKLWLNFNLCVSGYFKCSIITWESTNMLKRISGSPVFFYNPPTSFTNNVLRMDRSHYFSPFESNAAGTFSRIPRNHFFDFVALPAKLHWEKITRMTINTNSRAIVFRAPLLSHVLKNWRETNTYARRRRMPAVTLVHINTEILLALAQQNAPLLLLAAIQWPCSEF